MPNDGEHIWSRPDALYAKNNWEGYYHEGVKVDTIPLVAVLSVEYSQVSNENASSVHTVPCYPEAHVLPVFILWRAPFLYKVSKPPKAHKVNDKRVPKSINDPNKHQ